MAIGYSKVKTNGAKGRLGEKIAAVLPAFNFFDRLNNFLCILNRRLVFVQR
jgi:hypothetical protein